MGKKKATPRPPLPPATSAKEERYEESPPRRRPSSSAAATALPPRPTFVKQEPVKEEPIEPIEEEEEPEEEEPIEEEEEPILEEEEEEPMEEEEEEPMEEEEEEPEEEEEEPEEEEPMEEEEVEEVEEEEIEEVEEEEVEEEEEEVEEVEEEEEEPIEEEDTTEKMPVYIEELPMAAARVATEENSRELPMAEARAETENSRALQMTLARVATENGEPSNNQAKGKLVSTLLNVEESGNLVSPPPFLKSIDELQGLSAALTNFLSRYEEIEKHFSFIQNAISEKEGKAKEEEEEKKREEKAIAEKEEEEKKREEKAIAEEEEKNREQKAVAEKEEEEKKREQKAIAEKEEEVKKREEKAVAEKEEEEKNREEKVVAEKEEEEKKREEKTVAEKEEEEKKRDEKTVAEKEEEKKMEEKTIAEKEEEEEKKEHEPVTMAPKHQNIPPHYPSASLKAICQGMSSLGLRKYIQSNLHNFPKLLSEVPISLRRADDPSKLVFKCIGRFYLQGRKTFTKDKNLSTLRHAAILALEFFLLAECFKVNPSIKCETEAAALAWRNRMSSETTLSNIEALDAKGLLFFVASFGIPSSFTLRELVTLFLSSNLGEIAGPLRHSPFLMEKLPDIIQEMVKIGMAILAVYTIYNFGVQEKFPPEDILKSGLNQSEISWRKSHAFPGALTRANEKHIADLKSTLKCLHEWNVDPRKLGEWNSDVINAKIAKLEKENSDLEENAILKRKADTTSSEHVKNQELKRPRPSTGVSQQMHSTVMPIPEHRAVGLADGRRFFDGRFMGPINGYSGVSSVTGAAGGHLPGQITCTVGANSGHAAGPAAGLIVGNGTSLHPAPFSGNGGFHGDGFMKQTSNGAGSFMWHGDGAYHSNNSLGYNPMRPMVSMGRGTLATAQAMNPHFPGQPNPPLGFSSRESGSDLYQFADKFS